MKAELQNAQCEAATSSSRGLKDPSSSCKTLWASASLPCMHKSGRLKAHEPLQHKNFARSASSINVCERSFKVRTLAGVLDWHAERSCCNCVMRCRLRRSDSM